MTLAPRPAHAEGFELGGSGARGVGRASALAARATDGLSMYYNPALVARFDEVVVTGALHVNVSRYCFERQIVAPAGTEITIDDDGEVQGYRPTQEVLGAEMRDDGTFWMPEVCSSTGPSVIPNLGMIVPLRRGWALGFGLLAPNASRGAAFVSGAEATGITLEDPAERDYNGGRYLLTEASSLQAFPTVSLAYETPDGSTSLGLGFASGIVSTVFGTTLFAGGLGPATGDVAQEFRAQDFFVPRLSGGVHVRPRRGLEFGASFWWTAPVKTSNAEVELTVGLSEPLAGLLLSPTTDLANGELRDLDFDLLPPDGTLTPEQLAADRRVRTVRGASLVAPQTWNLSFGARYASELATPADDVGDTMSNERWDVEVDMRIRGNAPVDTFDVTLPEGMIGPSIALPTTVIIPHYWRNQVSVRAGGDYLAIPGRLALRTGVSYETHGVRRGNEQLDFGPFERFGLYGGLTVRVNRLDIDLAYGRIFSPNIRNGSETARHERVLGAAPDSGLVDVDCSDGFCDQAPVNAGIFRTGFDLVAIGATVHFGSASGAGEANEESDP